MSIRMRKQTMRKVIGADKAWVPGAGQYEHGSKRDVGNDPRRLQQWKSPLRNNTWMSSPTDAADVMYSSLIDHQSINSKVAKGEQRMATVMHMPAALADGAGLAEAKREAQIQGV